MPIYSFHNKATDERWEDFMTIRDMETLLASNPNIEQEFYALNIVSGVDGARRIDDGFKDVLKSIKKANRRSNIDTR